MKAITLMYHDVVAAGDWDASGFPGVDAARYKLDRDHFAAHLRAIADVTGGVPVAPFNLARAAQPPPPLWLTFDDGGVSAYTLIADLLEARGWRGHFFITTARVGTPAFLSPAHIRELHARGHVVGSHSHTHPVRMAHCSADELRAEWTQSVRVLTEILGAPVRTASVPGGFYSTRVAAAAAAAGVEVLFTSEPVARVRRVAGCMVLGRYGVWRSTPPEAAAAIAAGRRAPRMRQLLLWNAKKVGKSVGGEYYLKLRQTLIGHR